MWDFGYGVAFFLRGNDVIMSHVGCHVTRRTCSVGGAARAGKTSGLGENNFVFLSLFFASVLRVFSFSPAFFCFLRADIG